MIGEHSFSLFNLKMVTIALQATRESLRSAARHGRLPLLEEY